jgi:hypothetical protein
MNSLEFRRRVSDRLTAEAGILRTFLNHNNSSGRPCYAVGIKFTISDVRWMGDDCLAWCVGTCESCTAYQLKGIAVCHRDNANRMATDPDAIQAFYPLYVIRG